MKPTDTLIPPVVDVPAGFKDAPRRREQPSEASWTWAHRLVYAIAIGASFAMVFGGLGPKP